MKAKIFREIGMAVVVSAVVGTAATFGLTQTILSPEVRENPRATTTVGLIASLASGLAMGFLNASRKEKVVYKANLSPADALLLEWQKLDETQAAQRDHLMDQIIVLHQAEAEKAQASQIGLNATTQAMQAGTGATKDQKTSMKRA